MKDYKSIHIVGEALTKRLILHNVSTTQNCIYVIIVVALTQHITITAKSFNFVGGKFRGLTTLDMFVDT